MLIGDGLIHKGKTGHAQPPLAIEFKPIGQSHEITMTNTTDSDRTPGTETTSEVAPRTHHPGDPWERDNNDHDKPDTAPISDPPDHGAHCYYRLINTDTCSYHYMKDDDHLRFSWQGDINTIDEFEDALFSLYKSTYNSPLSAADLRPKAFETFAAKTVSEQLKATLYGNPIEGPPGPHNQHHKHNERIATTFSAAATLACEHRAQPGRRTRSKDAVLQSISPERVQR